MRGLLEAGARKVIQSTSHTLDPSGLADFVRITEKSDYVESFSVLHSNRKLLRLASLSGIYKHPDKTDPNYARLTVYNIFYITYWIRLQSTSLYSMLLAVISVGGNNEETKIMLLTVQFIMTIVCSEYIW